jgi:hypothetical protein
MQRTATTFARTVFTGAGVWGVAVLIPLYFGFDAIGRLYPPTITHPDFFYGFVGARLFRSLWRLAWSLASAIAVAAALRSASLSCDGLACFPVAPT